MITAHVTHHRSGQWVKCPEIHWAKTVIWIVCAGMWLLSGCRTPPPPSHTEMLDQTLPSIPTNSWSAAATAGEVDTGWIKTFKDAQLEAFIDEVLQNNLDLKTAAAQVEAAAASARRAGAALMPQVAAAGSSRYLDSFDSSRLGDGENTGAQLIVSWEIDVWGRIRAGRAAARSRYEATEADYQFARMSLVALAAKTWYLATETSLQLDYATEVAEVQQSTLELVQVKFEEGQLSRKGVFLASADLFGAKDRVQQITIAHKEAIRALELLLGRYPAAELEIMKDYVPLPPPVPAGIPSEILERRPDLIAAEKRAAAAFHLVTEAKMARLPRFSLTGAAGYSNSEILQIMDANDTYWTVAANFLAPIYTGGALKEQVKIRTAQQEAALIQYGQTALTAFNEVETALTNEPLLAEREKFLKAALEDNEGALDIAQTQFDNGKLDLLSVLQMQKRVIASKVTHISSRNERLAQRVDLHLALGGSF